MSVGKKKKNVVGDGPTMFEVTPTSFGKKDGDDDRHVCGQAAFIACVRDMCCNLSFSWNYFHHRASASPPPLSTQDVLSGEWWERVFF